MVTSLCQIAFRGAGPLVQALRLQGTIADRSLMIVDSGQDAATIGLLAGELAEEPGTTILASLMSRPLQRAIEQRLHAEGLALPPLIVNTAELVAAHFMVEHRLFLQALWRGPIKAIDFKLE